MDANYCQAVVFDLGDILYDASRWRRWLHGELSHRGCRLSLPDMVAVWESHLVLVYRGALAYNAALDGFLSRWIADPADRAEFLRISLAKKAEFESAREPLPDVPETLALLRAGGLRLAVLTDIEVPAAGVRAILDSLGLGGAFDAVVSSHDIGWAKPAPEAYRSALAALEADAAEAVFMGHDQEELDGAQAAGLATRSLETTGPTRGHQRLARFADLRELLP